MQKQIILRKENKIVNNAVLLSQKIFIFFSMTLSSGELSSQLLLLCIFLSLGVFFWALLSFSVYFSFSSYYIPCALNKLSLSYYCETKYLVLFRSAPTSIFFPQQGETQKCTMQCLGLNLRFTTFYPPSSYIICI